MEVTSFVCFFVECETVQHREMRCLDSDCLGRRTPRSERARQEQQRGEFVVVVKEKMK